MVHRDEQRPDRAHHHRRRDHRVPAPATQALPAAITAGVDQAVWFTLNQANAIGRITPSGQITLHPLPTPGAAPVGICGTADGAIWFVEIAAGQIGRIRTDGRIEEFSLPDRDARPHAIIADPTAGVCWFSAWAAGRIGHITPDGKIDEYDLPTPSSEPHGLTVAGDGTVHVALETGGLARLERAAVDP